jgi:hypothetical protein
MTVPWTSPAGIVGAVVLGMRRERTPLRREFVMLCAGELPERTSRGWPLVTHRILERTERGASTISVERFLGIAKVARVPPATALRRIIRAAVGARSLGIPVRSTRRPGPLWLAPLLLVDRLRPYLSELATPHLEPVFEDYVTSIVQGRIDVRRAGAHTLVPCGEPP